MDALTDADLWMRARAGDATAFGELYQRHARSVQSYCLWRTAGLQLAEDVTATTFLEVWRRRRRLELTTESAAPLLLGVATNVLRMLMAVPAIGGGGGPKPLQTTLRVT